MKDLEMSGMTMAALLPDAGMMTEVLRLANVADAARARGPARPLVSCPADHDPQPEIEEQAGLRAHLVTLSDDQQAQVHAVYWIGRNLTTDATQYSDLYHHALATDLGDDGAAYLSEKDPLGECLRRGLEKLGTDPHASGSPGGRSECGFPGAA
jgi:Protein of unknown function (DUF3775)